MLPAPLVALGVLGGAALATAALRPRRQRPTWHSITVLSAPDGIDTGRLTNLGGTELRLEPAPGERGTELHARFRRPPTPGRTRALRAALRDTKSIAETGGVVRVHPRPHGHRRRTPWGLAQDALERRARGLGLW